MDVTPFIKVGQQIIQAYAGGTFKVSSVLYDQPICVMPEKTVVWNVPQNTPITDMTIEHFDVVTCQASDIDVVLFGAGATMVFLPRPLKAALKDAGLPSVDIMDTGAACRTYNVLMAEGRRVACVLLPFK